MLLFHIDLNPSQDKLEIWDVDEDDSDDNYDISGIRDGHDFIACYGRMLGINFFRPGRLVICHNVAYRIICNRVER
ncbi:uncharacterized protein OCT59_001291 [Rhizophagus irregularis]|uniref:uncharacterized protein n=1 Tax=Rhizophagus irregularis TaxID=588596 RepID=UPI00331EB689|nr:hypothetical protein OCT59_001291 [Rhizophagus irregularis]